jgi:hypothetical protein
MTKPRRTCGYEGCGNSHYSLGWCIKHYRRVKTYGSPDGPPREPDLPGESWLPVPGYEGLYEISDHGRVYTLPRPRVPGSVLKTSVGEYGHLGIKLFKDGQNKHWAVHRLVLITFVGPCPEGQECRHLDGEAANNRRENLAWGTHAENMADQVRHGTNYWANRTHCVNGHEWLPGSFYVRPGGSRMCKQCVADGSQRTRQRNAGQTCTREGCNAPRRSRGLCWTHWREEARVNSVKRCTEDGCNEPAVSKGMCHPHYSKQWRQSRNVA